MKHYLLFIALMVCIWSADARATEPCNPLSQEEFKQRVKNTELIIYGQITGYSKMPSNNWWTNLITSRGKERSYNPWTTLKVLEVLQGQYQKSSIKIVGWTSVDRPFFYQPKGSEMILLLAPAENKNDMMMKYMKWDECVPSLMARRSDRTSTAFLQDFKEYYLQK